MIWAQSEYQMRANDKAIDINFLSSYYKQDGNNSAVEGGIGGEELIDAANILIVNVPLDSTKSLSVTAGADFYSSASTDRIDANVSSASIKDLRAYGNIGYTIKNLKAGTTYGVSVGFSSEYDYQSISGGLNFAKEWNEGNSEIGFQAKAFFDKWSLYFPAELRRTATVPTDKRNSYSLSSTYSQVLNKRLQMSLSAELIFMDGLLSTPFHRVYFFDQEGPSIEKLPSTRLKIPMSIRVNYFAHEKFVVRTYYRYYTDDFGVNGHTANLEIPIKITDSFSAAPFYRYHKQQGSDYFAPYAKHSASEEFYTSDFDLSTLSSKKYGLAFGYSPLYGISKASILSKSITFKSIELRLAYYQRDTGLNAYIGSVNFAFRL